MNKKGDFIDWFVPLVITGIVVFFIVVCVVFTFVSVGASSGSHVGYVTAVEHNSNIIWPADIVYFKTDTQSTQEDKYCVNDPQVRAQLLEAAENHTRVTISYANNFLMWTSECNGGSSIIESVK